jgi:hypothetical protein
MQGAYQRKLSIYEKAISKLATVYIYIYIYIYISLHSILEIDYNHLIYEKSEA